MPFESMTSVCYLLHRPELAEHERESYMVCRRATLDWKLVFTYTENPIRWLGSPSVDGSSAAGKNAISHKELKGYAVSYRSVAQPRKANRCAAKVC
jgi:hypothetical protein